MKIDTHVVRILQYLTSIDVNDDVSTYQLTKDVYDTDSRSELKRMHQLVDRRIDMLVDEGILQKKNGNGDNGLYVNKDAVFTPSRMRMTVPHAPSREELEFYTDQALLFDEGDKLHMHAIVEEDNGKTQSA